MSVNSFNSRSTLKVGKKEYEIYRLDALDKQGISTTHLPFSLRILLENLLRTEDGRNVTKEEVRALANWNSKSKPEKEIAFTPSRVLLQDFTGVPCVVDLAAMRDAMKTSGWRSHAHQSPAARRIGHRPLRASRRVRHPASVRHECPARIPAQQRALFISPLGANRIPQSRHRSSRHRHRPPGQSRIPRPRRLRPRIPRQTHRLPRHAGRHRQSYDNGEWVGGAGLGSGGD